jgi:hypothetical protein
VPGPQIASPPWHNGTFSCKGGSLPAPGAHLETTPAGVLVTSILTREQIALPQGQGHWGSGQYPQTH